MRNTNLDQGFYIVHVKGCLFGKQSNMKVSFLVEKSKRAKEPLELVHTNVYDLSGIRSFGDSKYVLTFKNNFIRKT